MERFKNKVAVVTGSSLGIGKAISKELVKHGVVVVGLARRLEKLEELNEELKASNYVGKFYPMKCDVRKELEVQSTFTRILSEIGPIHILVNNAATRSATFLIDASAEEISEVFDTNVKGALLCAKGAINCMIDQSIEGHIINIIGLLGRNISKIEPNFNMILTGSKHALTVLSEGLRREMVYKKTNIKVTSINPGWVRTERTDSIVKKVGKSWDEMEKMFLGSEDVANACISVLNTPHKVLISELTVMPIHEVPLKSITEVGEKLKMAVTSLKSF